MQIGKISFLSHTATARKIIKDELCEKYISIFRIVFFYSLHELTHIHTYSLCVSRHCQNIAYFSHFISNGNGNFRDGLEGAQRALSTVYVQILNDVDEEEQASGMEQCIFAIPWDSVEYSFHCRQALLVDFACFCITQARVVPYARLRYCVHILPSA